MSSFDSLGSEIARRSLVPFCERTITGWQRARHLDYIAALLEQVERGEIQRLIVSLPVRHGKSVLASQAFAAWYLGRNPRQAVLLASHNEGLAESHSRAAKHIVEGPRYPFDAGLADETAAARFALDNGASMRALGTGSGASGFSADLLLGDDLNHDSFSESDKSQCYNWWRTVAMPRLNPGGKVVIIGARLASDDLIGRILESPDGDTYTYIALPAIAQHDDPLGREPGEALWPKRFSLGELAKRRGAMTFEAFESQFQQNPSTGAATPLFNVSDLRLYERLPHPEAPTWNPLWLGYVSPFEYARKDGSEFVNITGIDTAGVDNTKPRDTNSANALVTISLDTITGDMYIVSAATIKHCDYFTLRTKVSLFLARAGHQVVVIEGDSTGALLAGDLRNTSRHAVHVVKPKLSKRERLAQVVDLIKDGKVFVREEHRALFDPTVRGTQDSIDALVYALRMARALRAARQARDYYGRGLDTFELFA